MRCPGFLLKGIYTAQVLFLSTVTARKTVDRTISKGQSLFSTTKKKTLSFTSVLPLSDSWQWEMEEHNDNGVFFT